MIVFAELGDLSYFREQHLIPAKDSIFMENLALVTRKVGPSQAVCNVSCGLEINQNNANSAGMAHSLRES